MDVGQLLNALDQGKFSRGMERLYPNVKDPDKRYLSAVKAFSKLYPDRTGLRLFSVPGRTEIGGNHTDHNHGRVLSGAVGLDAIAVCAENGTDLIRLKSEGYGMDTVDISDLSVRENEKNTSAALIRGVCARFKQLGHPIGGFDAYTASDVLSGSGLSSSAAFEVLTCKIISGLFGADITAIEMAQVSQYAENVYYGKPCGLMDQIACSAGGFVFIDFENPLKPSVKSIPFEFSKTGHSLCIVNTGGSHAGLSGAYDGITKEMAQVSGLLGVSHLRHFDESLFYERLPFLRGKVSDRALLRAMHFYAEDRRAYLQADALLRGDFDGFLKFVNESGRSSCMYLQNAAIAGDGGRQELLLGLALSDKLLSGRGAFRVHGGGFAGTLQAYVPDDMLEAYRAFMESLFGEGSCRALSIRPVGAAELTAP